MSDSEDALEEMNAHEHIVPEQLDGERLDRFLASQLQDVSRSQVQKHIESGCVSIDGQPPARGSKTILRTGQSVVHRPPPIESSELVAEDIPLSIVFEDEHIVVVDKPAGLVVHPAVGHPRGTLVNALLHHIQDLGGIGGELRPGIVHRLDKGTTGLILVAKHDRAHAGLVESFQARTIDKEYLAVTMGVPRPAQDTIDTLHGRHPRDRMRFTTRVDVGKRAVTEYELEELLTGSALLRVRIETGRTHQIRVHLAEIKSTPLVGDDLYGSRRMQRLRDDRIAAIVRSFGRPALHAHRLRFAHPITRARLELEAAVPDDLERLIEALRAAGDGGPSA